MVIIILIMLNKMQIRTSEQDFKLLASVPVSPFTPSWVMQRLVHKYFPKLCFASNDILYTAKRAHGTM